jgi:carbonic anhydrase/acetyltransferase-like protein (isoleucine patch superfamily)
MENTSKPANVAVFKHSAGPTISNTFLRTKRSPEAGITKVVQNETAIMTQRYPDAMIRAFAGSTPVVPSSCYIDDSAQLVGDVQMGEHSSVWINAVLRGDVHSIRVGARSNVQDNAVLHGQRGMWPVLVGAGCTIGHGAIVHGCVLEDDVLVGMGAVIPNGARVGAGSIIAAGAVVTEGAQIPPASLVAGVPGKLRRALHSTDLDLIRTYAQNYLDYTALYLAERAGVRIEPIAR